jgi:ABC-type nickel/cobalt efflux system permease component RcnA
MSSTATAPPPDEHPSPLPPPYPFVRSFLPIVRTLVGLVVGLVLAELLWAAPAGAHPLGNFTTNRYARIEAGTSSLRIHYVLDEAELVAFRERTELAKGEEVFAETRAAEIARALRLRVDGQTLRLGIVDHRLTQPEGQGGLTTLRLEILFEAPVDADPGEAVEVTFQDENQPERLGWREIVAQPLGDARLTSSDVPARDRTSALREYPSDPAIAPLDVRRATFSYVPGRGSDPPARLGEVGTASGPRADRFVGLVTSTTSSPLAVVSALALALAFGGVHALGPGHGKTVMAAYLVSTRGRRRDALYLGAVVSLMHTASVLALAVVLATVGRNIEAERVYPALTLLAGVLVTGVGARLVLRRWRARVAAPDHEHHDHGHGHGDDHSHVHGAHQEHDTHAHDDHSHAHDDHSRAHDDDHGHDHGGHHGHADRRASSDLTHDHGGGRHSHVLPADVAPLSRAGLLALGSSGGLFPSPSAVVVLVGAFTLGRAPLGLALIAAFSVGLAAVLVAVGLLLVAGRDRINRSSWALRIRWLPVAGAASIVLLGLVLLVQGIGQLR